MASAEELVESCSDIFTLPEVYFRVRDVVDDQNSSMEDLANGLKIDPAISARLLKIVNSPLYGFPKQVDTVTRAVNLLGMQAVSDLVTATTVGRTFSGLPTDLMDVPAFWRKSILCALLAGKIAKACGVQDSERFFIEGLLRDIGHLVLYQTVPQRAHSALVEADNLNTPLADVEQSNIGCDFAEVGAALIRHWGMPPQIEQAIRHQLNPAEAGEFSLHASIIHIAGSIADAEAASAEKKQQELPYHAFALTSTKFNPHERPALTTEAHAQVDDMLQLFSPMAMAA